MGCNNMILNSVEKAFVFSNEARRLIDDYIKRHNEPPPPYNRDEFSSLEEWIALLKS